MTDNTKDNRKIILIDGANAPEFIGQWTIGEVLAMADALARWVQSLAVSQPAPQNPETAKDK